MRREREPRTPITDRVTELPPAVARASQPSARRDEATRSSFQPASLSSLVPAERDRAWDAFVSSHSALLIRVARIVLRDHDAAMDAYASILGHLRDDDFKRLGAYRVTDGCTFETWLAVVARRLCLDYHRHKYGRARGDDALSLEAQTVRKRLADLISVELDFQPDLATNHPSPDAALNQAEVVEALNAILADLAARDRLLLRYRFDDELPAIQIMRVMKFRSVFHVYRRVNSILALCRTSLEQQGFRSSDL